MRTVIPAKAGKFQSPHVIQSPPHLIQSPPHLIQSPPHVIPAKAGIQYILSSPKGCKIKKCGAARRKIRFWIPAFAGMTEG
jgi:hypothetical protein